MKSDVPAYGELRLTLPRFVIMTLREMVKKANQKKKRGETPWTVSILMEKWLLQGFGKEKAVLFQEIADKSPEFVAAAEAWLRLEIPKGFRKPEVRSHGNLGKRRERRHPGSRG